MYRAGHRANRSADWSATRQHVITPTGYRRRVRHDLADHHDAHHQHAHQGSTGPEHSLTRQAIDATRHCLTGCAIGEVLGMVIGTALGWHTAATVIVSIALAFLFGYALTMRSVLRSDVSFRRALGVALAADTVSIAVMELVDNAVVLLVPGAMAAGLTSPLFWGSLAASLAIAFVVTVPVNRALIARGRGHAAMHAYH
jgi:Domain of unknown function (DUF4396)